MAANHMDRIKLVVVGDSGVGKSSFVHGIVNQTTLNYPSSTIGCNVEVMPYTYLGRQGHQREVFLELWEIGGSSGQRNSRSIFYQSANGLILVHDLSNRKSFLNLNKWLREVLNSGKQEMTGVTVRGQQETYNYDGDKQMTNVVNLPVLVLGTKEDQSSVEQSITRSGRHIGLNDENLTFFCDMNCLQSSQLLSSSAKREQLNTFFEKVIENRFYPSGNLTQESEYWRGRKKLF